MTEGTRDHVFAATHFLLGPTNFLVLRLPAAWQVRIGRNPSEVDYSTTLGGIRWAAEGSAAGLLINPAERRGIEVEIRTARGAIRPAALEWMDSGSCTIGGHRASCAFGEVRVGLTRRHRIRALHIAFRCEETKRNVDLRFLGRCELDELKALLPTIAGSRCH